MLLALSISEKGRVSRLDFGERLLNIDDRYCKPGTGCGKFKAGGSPDFVAEGGFGNGAAMRISPVGIVTPPSLAAQLIADVVAVSTLTHNTPPAISGTVFVAAAVSAAMEGYSRQDVIEYALNTIRAYESGIEFPGLRMSETCEYALQVGLEAYVESLTSGSEWGFIAIESVPAVFAAVASGGSLADTLLRCVNLGGDADSIASMAGAILGTLYPGQWPEAWTRYVCERNGLDLEPIARSLAALRADRAQY
ncbi:MAG: ADP-ribosylglycohydrolase family protein [Limnochordales bacterium]|nr:ADP-ribosylglycohydrolase family protein [Limnochordales bacterium]